MRDLSLETRQGWTPLHYAVDFRAVASVEHLLGTGGPSGAAASGMINVKDRAGRTPLAIAARHGDLEIVDALLAHGADPASADRAGRTPFLVAAASAHWTVVVALLATGDARVAREAVAHRERATGRCVLAAAIAAGCSDELGERMYAQLRSAGMADEATVDTAGRTVLHYAAEWCLYATADAIISGRAALTAIDSPSENAAADDAEQRQGRPALAQGQLVSPLLGHPDRNGALPLHLAAQSGSLAVAELLLGATAAWLGSSGAGGSVGTLRDASGNSALDYAARALHDVGSEDGLELAAVVALFEQAGCRGRP
jgi:ankyrin repeat protein